LKFRGEGMAANVYKKGPKLFSLARKKAINLEVSQEKGIKLAQLICKIQEKEGNDSCFRKRPACSQTTCCWQASCGAKMVAE
jgi:hypothetical protein